MSADNGIYIAEFKDGFRVIYASAIDNLYFFKEGSEEEKAEWERYFGKSEVFLNEDDAVLTAWKMSKEFPTLEYGISNLGKGVDWMKVNTIVKYDSNNSGGRWWLKEKDWLNLENAGWKVEWEEFLDSPATQATRAGLSLKEAIAEWETITNQDANALGCECCGQPHNFWEVDEE